MKGAAILFVASFVLAGCASKPAPAATCTPTQTSPDATGVCFITGDGWILQGVEWNQNASRGPILLVHGLNENHHSYDVLARELAGNHTRVLAFDSRGHGASIHRTDGSTRRLSDFTQADIAAMERDLDPIRAELGNFSAVGASVGANEVLRTAATTQAITRVVLLSPGVDYQGLKTQDAAKAYPGPVAFFASKEDSYAAQSCQALADVHNGPELVKIWTGKGHGTQMLDPETRAAVKAWLEA